LNLPLFKSKKGKYAVVLATDQILYSDTLEYSEKGVKIGQTASSYTFIPYDAILRVDYDENYSK
jgi:hypothetical protein